MLGHKNRLINGDYEESTRYLKNPDCGWYHIYTIYPQNPVDKDALYSIIADDEKLALLFINIGRYRNEIPGEEAALRLKEVFDVFISRGMHMIIRAAYDNAGLGMTKEPAQLDIVRTHMKFFGSIFQEYSDYILTVQGLFVGSWGEMHSSKHLVNDAVLRELAETMYKAVDGKCCISVRRPDQYRVLKGTIPVSRLALFNDAIGASESDMNTYGCDKNVYEDYTEEEIRRIELRWQSSNVYGVPNGGEVLFGEKNTPGSDAIKDFEDMHLTYLNSAYDTSQLDVWRKEKYTGRDIYNGLSMYDYIGTHLGYRFVVRNAGLTRKNIIYVDIENIGFAALYKEAVCELELCADTGETVRVNADYDMRSIKSGQKKRIEINISKYNVSSEKYSIYISMYSKVDKEPIKFANNSAGAKMFLGKIC